MKHVDDLNEEPLLSLGQDLFRFQLFLTMKVKRTTRPANLLERIERMVSLIF